MSRSGTKVTLQNFREYLHRIRATLGATGGKQCDDAETDALSVSDHGDYLIIKPSTRHHASSQGISSMPSAGRATTSPAIASQLTQNGDIRSNGENGRNREKLHEYYSITEADLEDLPLFYSMEMVTEQMPTHSPRPPSPDRAPDLTSHLIPDSITRSTEGEVCSSFLESFDNGTNNEEEDANERESAPHADFPKVKDRRTPALEKALWGTLRTRATYAERRSELRESRSSIIAADMEFMKLVRQMRNHHTGHYEHKLLDEIEDKFQALQGVRNRHGPIEESVTAIEDHLDAKEYKITELITDGGAPESDTSGDDKSSSDQDSEVSSASAENVEVGLYNEYLSRIGDFKLLQETYSELVFEYARLREIKERNIRFGIQMLREDLNTLDEFEDRQAELQSEIRATEEDIKRLQGQCVEQGISMDNSSEDWGSTIDEAIAEEDRENDDILEDPISVDPSNDVTSYNRILEGLPGMLEDPIRRPDSRTQNLLNKFNSPYERISQWVLHHVHSSFHEVRRLRRIYRNEPSDAPTYNIDKWQDAVLNSWNTDDPGGHSLSEVLVTVTEWSDATQRPINRDYDGDEEGNNADVLDVDDGNDVSLEDFPNISVAVRHRLAFGQVLMAGLGPGKGNAYSGKARSV
jgi:hypothetical protein